MEHDPSSCGDQGERQSTTTEIESEDELARDRANRIINDILVRAQGLDEDCHLSNAQRQMRVSCLTERIDTCFWNFYRATRTPQSADMLFLLLLEHVISPLLDAEIERFLLLVLLMQEFQRSPRS